MRWYYPLHLPVGACEKLEAVPKGIRPYSALYLSELERVREMRRDPRPEDHIEYGVEQMEDAGISPTKVAPARRALMGAEIITCDEKYKTREHDAAGVGKCFWHWISSDLATRPIETCHGATPEIAKRIEKLYPARVARRKKNQKERTKDDPIAQRVTADQEGYHLPDLPEADRDHITVRCLADDAKFAIRDTTSFRLHTAVGRLKKTFRPYLRHDSVDDVLAIVDISSSQMVIAALWSMRGITRRCPDTEQFLRHAVDRTHPDLYQYLAEETNDHEPLPGIHWTARDESEDGTIRSAKREAIACLYDTPHRMRERSPVGRTMLRLYPELYERMNERRSVECVGRSAFAVTIQTIESRIMIDGALAQLQGEYPEVPWLPMHDGMMCPAPLADHCVTTIRRHWRRVLQASGVASPCPPRVSVKLL